MSEQYSQNLKDWYDTASGRKLKQQIRQSVRELTVSLPGTQHAQICVGEWASLKKHALCLRYDDVFGSEVNPEVLPNTMETLMLVHALDVDENPQKVLHIADKLVSSSGYLVIVGFNPISYFGLLRLFLMWRKKAPWAQGFHRSAKVTDWLKVLNYRVDVKHSVMLLPTQKLELAQSDDSSIKYIIKGLVSWLLPQWGAVYILVAKQPRYPMTGFFQRKRKQKEALIPVTDPTPNRVNSQS